MEKTMNNLLLSMISFFDGGKNVSEKNDPERFYHGFVLGLIVELRERYLITSNRESGLGRADVIMIPEDKVKDDGIIIEFKVFDSDDEDSLEDTVQSALSQINEI